MAPNILAYIEQSVWGSRIDALQALTDKSFRDVRK